ncbi:hypothetical protein J4406_02290 [Candidatus Woesearchaeota archaeon]|nr:hypothetical protein [Candidatus Woesearchaeota archaeon]
MVLEFIPALVLTPIIGLYELFLIHHDENFRGSHWIGHGLSTFVTILIGLLIVFNVPYFLELTNLASKSSWLANVWIVRSLIGLIILIRIHAQSAVVKTTIGSSKGLKETWFHSLIIVVLIVTAPLYWVLIEPLVKNIIPL